MAKAKTSKGLDPKGSVLDNAALVIETRLDEMLHWSSYIADADNVTELHEMRIAAKRLRYTLEIFRPAFARHTIKDQPYSEILSVVKALQEHLGTIHDSDVLVPQLTQHLACLLADGYGSDDDRLPIVGVHRVDFDGCAGLIALCRETRAVRDGAYLTLLDLWRQHTEADTFTRLRDLLKPDYAPEPELAQIETLVPTPSSRRTRAGAGGGKSRAGAEKPAPADDPDPGGGAARKSKSADAAVVEGHSEPGADPTSRPAKSRANHPKTGA